MPAVATPTRKRRATKPAPGRTDTRLQNGATPAPESITVELTARQVAIIDEAAALMGANRRQAVLASAMHTVRGTFDNRSAIREALCDALEGTELDSFRLGNCEDSLADDDRASDPELDKAASSEPAHAPGGPSETSTLVIPGVRGSAYYERMAYDFDAVQEDDLRVLLVLCARDLGLLASSPASLQPVHP